MGKVARRSRERIEAKRLEILEAAKSVFIAQGKHAKMPDIAARVGMDTSSLYYYFKGIPEILNALLVDKYRHLEAYELKISSPEKSHLTMLEEMLAYLLEFYYENLLLIEIVLTQVFPLFHSPHLEDESEAINDYLTAYWQANEVLVRHIVGAQKAGAIDGNITPEAGVQLIRGAMWGVVASWRERRPPKQEIPGCARRILRLVAC